MGEMVAPRPSYRWVGSVPLVVTAGLMVWGLLSGSHLPPRYDDPRPGRTDTDLYVAVADRVALGQDYYAAVAAEQPARGYPTRPFLTVREPVLAWLEAAVGGEDPLRLVFLVLAAGVLFALSAALGGLAGSRWSWIAATLVATVSLGLVGASRAPATHEAWAGLLIVAAVCLRRPGRTWPVVLALLVAALFREITAVLLVLLLAEAVMRRDRRSALVAAAGAAVFAGFYAWHMVQAIGIGSSGGRSTGWLGLGLWPAVVDGIRFGSPLVLLPFAVSAVLVPLAALGWAGRRGAVATSVWVVLGVGCVLLGVLGRPDNAYWGLMFSTVLLPGLAFAPAALASGLRALFSHDDASGPLPFP